MKYLTLSLEEIETKPTGVLRYDPKIAFLPEKRAIVDSDADAGHVAALAMYLTGGMPDNLEVACDEAATEFLRSDEFANRARRRGVTTDANGESVICTSNDATAQVEIRWFQSAEIPVT